MDLSEKEIGEIVQMYYGHDNSIRQVRDFWAGMHPTRPIPSKSFIHKCIKRLQETGNPLPKKRGGNRRVRAGENTAINVLAAIDQNPEQSCFEIASNAGVSTSSVFRVLKQHNFKSFKIQGHQELLPADTEARVNFCEQVFNKVDNNANFIRNICFTDESTFTLHKQPNKQNTRIWATENPHKFLQTRTQWPQKVNVWLGILGPHIIGPFYIDGNLNGDKYLEMLQQQIYPEIQRVMANRLGDVWFQQDGCPSHYTRAVTQFLNEHFPNRWIGRGGTIHWPPRSPDLSPNDFHFWGHIKNKVYSHRRFHNLNELREAINATCRTFSAKHLSNVRQEFYDRLSHCMIQEGSHFEHLLK